VVCLGLSDLTGLDLTLDLTNCLLACTVRVSGLLSVSSSLVSSLSLSLALALFTSFSGRFPGGAHFAASRLVLAGMSPLASASPGVIRLLLLTTDLLLTAD